MLIELRFYFVEFLILMSILYIYGDLCVSDACVSRLVGLHKTSFVLLSFMDSKCSMFTVHRFNTNHTVISFRL